MRSYDQSRDNFMDETALEMVALVQDHDEPFMVQWGKEKIIARLDDDISSLLMRLEASSESQLKTSKHNS